MTKLLNGMFKNNKYIFVSLHAMTTWLKKGESFGNLLFFPKMSTCLQMHSKHTLKNTLIKANHIEDTNRIQNFLQLIEAKKEQGN